MPPHSRRKKRRACPTHGWQNAEPRRRAPDGRYLCHCGKALLTQHEYAELSLKRSAARGGRR